MFAVGKREEFLAWNRNTRT